MQKHSTSLTPWEATPQQVYAAQLLARGWTWQRTADEVGVSIRTISNWVGKPEFMRVVDGWVARISEALETQLVEGTQEMLTLWRQMVRGEVPADDKRLDRIGPTIAKLFDASIAWTDTPASAAPRQPGMAVQVNVNSGPGGER